MLLLFTGLPGSGKTTLARAYAASCNAVHFNSDTLRQEMGLKGKYGPQDKEKVYDALLHRTKDSLQSGKTVVVDSTFYKESIRAPFRRIALALNVPIYWIEVVAQEEVIRERLQHPRPDSEADFSIYQKIRDAYEPLSEPHLTLHSDEGTPEQLTALIGAYLEPFRNGMSFQQIQSLASGGQFPGASQPVECVETHISWLILTPDYAFKIKKPIRLAFLDFSTPEKRAFCCAEEVRLNARLAPEMYLDVLPVCKQPDDTLKIGTATVYEYVIDYAVRMKRMDNSRQMDLLLQQNAVTEKDMADMAQLLAPFHRSVVLLPEQAPYRPDDNRADFEDLFLLKKEILRLFGPQAGPTLDRWKNLVENFLERCEPRLHERVKTGFRVDGHGDLHGRNIFLLPQGPLVFDCIEFNPHLRQIDVLSELAFLCMDLDAGGHHELSEAFMRYYLALWPCIENAEDEHIFVYFKAYRANVRLKVALLGLEQHSDTTGEKDAKTYWALLEKYLEKVEQFIAPAR
ncbi:MAG TPA: AAA family ATPase [Saprospiraceae bacterium]|nr:AAA family ATPase [Saprospiraceae bacterium]HPI07897.1 AAA family ATPase [Saprospiraceae bacterium]